MPFFSKLKTFFTQPIPFLTTTVEELEADHYLLFQLSPTEFELRLRKAKIGSLSLQTVDSKTVGRIEINDAIWLLKPGDKKWPKEFVVEKVGGGAYFLRMSVLGFGGTLEMDNRKYVFTAGGGRIITIHDWVWNDSDGKKQHLEVTSRGKYPPGVSVVSLEQANTCPDAILLIMLARYLQKAYISGY